MAGHGGRLGGRHGRWSAHMGDRACLATRDAGWLAFSMFWILVPPLMRSNFMSAVWEAGCDSASHIVTRRRLDRCSKELGLQSRPSRRCALAVSRGRKSGLSMCALSHLVSDEASQCPALDVSGHLFSGNVDSLIGRHQAGAEKKLV